MDTKNAIENMTDEQVRELLKEKWIAPIVSKFSGLSDSIVSTLISELTALSKKYETTFEEIESEIHKTETLLCSMMNDLTGNNYDMQGIAELKKLLGGVQNDEK